MNQEHKDKINKSLKATRERRAEQICKVFEVKIVENHLSKATKEQLKLLFLECKWLYNYALSQEDCFNVDYKLDKVQIKVDKTFEERVLKTISSHIRQEVLQGLKQNIISLSKSKKKGNIVGALKHICRYESINLKQYNNTFKINANGKYIKILGIKQHLKVKGLSQIHKDYDIANAKLIKKPRGYYIKITCFINKPTAEEQARITIEKNKKQPVGLDFGIASQVVLSNGIDIKYQIPVASKKMRRLCQELSRKEKHSSNFYKARIKLSKEYERLNNQKKDIKNKIFNILETEFSTIAYQNDCMQGWQYLWGTRMLNTAIGGITARLKKCATSVEVDRYFPSTKQCPICLCKQKVELDERTFVCETCGYTKPRDLKSAQMILNEGLSKIGAERIEFKPVENNAYTLAILNRLGSIPYVNASLLCEAGSQRL